MDLVYIVSTGGTFNKIYNLFNGELEVDASNMALQKIEKKWLTTLNYTSIINKDSLDFTNSDRNKLANFIKDIPYSKIIVIHGTDTIYLSAKEIAKLNLNKTIIFTGAMKPFSIDKVEATANFAMAYGYILNAKSGVYITLNGVIDRYDQIIKNKKLGKFELKKIN